ncbi:MAG: shikimate dehydrogenase [Fibrobacteres bacterium]|nr:shikimate dehydrogenase [Fibrobacterota bacterium]
MKGVTVSEKRSAVTGTTKLIGVMGWPVSHSRSPRMHNAALQAMKLDFIYVPLPVDPRNVKAAVEAIRAFNMAGSNVTIPHKESVVPYMDKLTDTAKLIGAVNTIVNNNGKLTGHTTDPEGICGALNRAGSGFNGQNVVIVGSGGSARTALFTALLNGAAKVTLLARNKKKSAALLTSVKKSIKGSRVDAVEMATCEASDAVKEADLLINSTPIGMGALAKETPVDKKLLHSGLTVFDMVYAPPVTRLLREAKASGAKTVQGIDMLVCQGMASFEMWTGKKASYKVFREGFGK